MEEEYFTAISCNYSFLTYSLGQCYFARDPADDSPHIIADGDAGEKVLTPRNAFGVQLRFLETILPWGQFFLAHRQPGELALQKRTGKWKEHPNGDTHSAV